ncbi:hypothetical protein, partial [Desulfobulbus alkaliphilus]|uniref:hypothetical protein n=1 Tax=Desulfobulbus alkaliphilus TaxID=869814 RepID=UPI0019654E3A
NKAHVYIGEKDIYIHGFFFPIGRFGNRMESLEYSDQPVPHILLIYSAIQSSGRGLPLYRREYSLRIPIPLDKQQTGHEMAIRLNHVFTRDKRATVRPLSEHREVFRPRRSRKEDLRKIERWLS